MTHPDGGTKITARNCQIVGCSRETVGRMKMLEDQNLISAHGKTINVYGTRYVKALLPRNAVFVFPHVAQADLPPGSQLCTAQTLVLCSPVAIGLRSAIWQGAVIFLSPRLLQHCRS